MVVVIEWVGGNVLVELCVIGCELCLEIVEDVFWQVVWIVFGFYYQWWYCVDDCCFWYWVVGIVGDVVDNFVVVGGMVDMDCFVYFEVFDYCCYVVGVVVYVMVVLDLVGVIVVMVVVGYYVKVFGEEEQYLCILVVGIQWLVMMEVDYLGVVWFLVFVEEFDVIFCCYVIYVVFFDWCGCR